MVPAKSGRSPTFHHLLGGAPTIPAVVSPNSGRPLLQMALLDTADPRLELQTAGFAGLPLVYSWTCDISQGVFTYGVAAERIELLDFQPGQSYTKFPYAHYPEAFPAQTMELVLLAPDAQRRIVQLNDTEQRLSFDEWESSELDVPRHQIGGIPRLMQGPLTPKCPRCAGEMPLLASIADDTGTPNGFTGNPYVQVVFHLCRRCWTVSCYNMCD